MPNRRVYTGYLESRLQDWAIWCARSADHGLGYPKAISAFRLWRSPQVWEYPELRAVIDAAKAEEVQDIISCMAQNPETALEAAIVTYWYVGKWPVRRVMAELEITSVKGFYGGLDRGRDLVDNALKSSRGMSTYRAAQPEVTAKM
jgi:hypothetical protein